MTKSSRLVLDPRQLSIFISRAPQSSLHSAARITDSSSKTQSAFHPHARQNALRCRDVRLQSRSIRADSHSILGSIALVGDRRSFPIANRGYVIPNDSRVGRSFAALTFTPEWRW